VKKGDVHVTFSGLGAYELVKADPGNVGNVGWNQGEYARGSERDESHEERKRKDRKSQAVRNIHVQFGPPKKACSIIPKHRK
jgi:hypothetical protein